MDTIWNDELVVHPLNTNWAITEDDVYKYKVMYFHMLCVLLCSPKIINHELRGTK